MHAVLATTTRPSTTGRTRWGRDQYDLTICLREQDADLVLGLQVVQDRLGLPGLAPTARCLLGLASLDVMPWSPEEAGRHTGRVTRVLSLRGDAPRGDPAAYRIRPSRQSTTRRQIAISLDIMLYAPVAIRCSLRKRHAKSVAARELLRHALGLLDAGGERVDAFLVAHSSALAGEVGP